MHKTLCFCFLGSCLGLCLAGTAAQAQAPLFTTCVTNEQLRHYATVASPQLSPDGAAVVYAEREGTASGAATHLWLAKTSGATEPRQLTFSPANDHFGESAPNWMPDGSAILFLAKRGEERQIFRLSMAGGEAAPLKLEIPAPAGSTPAELTLNVAAYAISPDGRWIAARAPQPLTVAEEKKIKDKEDAKIVNEDPHHERVWLYSFASGQTVAATVADREAEGMAWSPDSTELAVITEPPGGSDDLGPRHRVELITVGNPGTSRIANGAPPTVSAIAFSPSGQDLALLAQSSHDTPPGIAAVFVMPAAGGAPRDLSDASGLTVAGRALIWRRDGTAIYVQAQRRTEGALGRFPVAGGSPEWLSAGVPIATNFATNRRQTGWVFVGQATDRLPQVEFATGLNAAGGTILSRANSDWAGNGWMPGVEVSWQGPGDQAVQGLYFAPQTARCADAAVAVAGKTPLIVVVHGGPTGAFLQTFSPFVQLLAAQGWAVLEPNPRGSTGYGWQFAAANKNDLGGRDFADVMAGVDWTLANRPIDARRLGLYGYSYGGEMAGFVEGKTDRFAAVVSGAPVIDQYSEYGTEDGSWYDRWFFGRPWIHPQDAWRQSPLAYAAQARTPLLLLQGQADITDPLGQSEEMYRALRQMGVPVRLVTFPREVHGTLGGAIAGAPSAEPWHGFEARRQLLGWFRTHFAH